MENEDSFFLSNSKNSNNSRRRLIRLRELYYTFKAIVDQSDWSFDDRVYTCTIYFLKNGKESELQRMGTRIESLYNLMIEYLFSYSKEGFKIELLKDWDSICSNKKEIKVLEKVSSLK